jgi:hypothetical protein
VTWLMLLHVNSYMLAIFCRIIKNVTQVIKILNARD